MNRTLFLLVTILAVAIAIAALVACGSNTSGDDDDDDDDDDTGDDDTGDDDSGDDDDDSGDDDDDDSGDDDDDDSGDDDDDDEPLPPAGCADICDAMAECDAGWTDDCVATCEAAETDVQECFGYGVNSLLDCDQFDYYWDVCLNMDEQGRDIGDRMADFVLQNQNGEYVHLYDYVGHVVLINVSAGWCGPCREEAGALEDDIYQVYKDDRVMVLSLLFENYSGGQPTEAFLANWASRFGVTFQILGDTSWRVGSKYVIVNDDNTVSIPQNIVIGRDMTIDKKVIGYSESTLSSWIEALL